MKFLKQWVIDKFASMSFGAYFISFVTAFISGGFGFASLYWLGCEHGWFNFGPEGKKLDFTEALYFSFITQLTIGYGDLFPQQSARFLAISQGIFGVIFFAIGSGLVILKGLVDKTKIKLSKWAAYSLDDERFFCLYAYQGKGKLLDADLTGIVRLDRYDYASPSVKPAFIDSTVCPFILISSDKLKEVPIKFLAELQTEKKFDKNDGLKVSINGTSGITRCITAKRYSLSEIYVLRNTSYYYTDEFINYKNESDLEMHFTKPFENDAKLFSNFPFSEEAKNEKRPKKKPRRFYDLRFQPVVV